MVCAKLAAETLFWRGFCRPALPIGTPPPKAQVPGFPITSTHHKQTFFGFARDLCIPSLPLGSLAAAVRFGGAGCCDGKPAGIPRGGGAPCISTFCTVRVHCISDMGGARCWRVSLERFILSFLSERAADHGRRVCRRVGDSWSAVGIEKVLLSSQCWEMRRREAESSCLHRTLVDVDMSMRL